MRPTTKNSTPTRTLALAAALIVALTLSPRPASAAFTTFTDRTAFLAAAGSPITTETFDEIPAGTTYNFGVLNTGGFTFFLSPNSSIFADEPFFPSESPPNFLYSNLDQAGITFGGGASNAVGFALSIEGDLPAIAYPALYTATVIEADGTTTVVPLSYAGPGVDYLGFVESGLSPSGIVEVALTSLMNPNHAMLPIAFDDVTSGPVTAGNYPLVNPYATPEPASAILLGIGLAAVGLRMRWKGWPGRW